MACSGSQILQGRWLAPDHRYFKVLGDDNAIYIIRHDQEKWQWELTFFSALTNKMANQ